MTLGQPYSSHVHHEKLKHGLYHQERWLLHVLQSALAMLIA